MYRTTEIMSETLTIPRPVKRKLKKQLEKTLKKLKPFKEKIILRDNVNQLIGSSPIKLWFEIVTNIPNGTKVVDFDINLTNEGLRVVYKQDSYGPTFETFVENSINDDIIQDGKLVLKSKQDSSSVYGSGYVTIGQYSSEVIISSNDSIGDSWQLNFFTNELEEITPLTDCNFKVELLIPFNNKMGGWKNYITSLRSIIEEVDAKNIVDGREYKFTVNDIGSGSDGLNLNKPLQPKIPLWVDEVGNSIPNPQYTSLKVKGKWTDAVVIESPSNNERDSSLTFEIKSVGKVSSDYKLSGSSGDKPMLVVYYKGTNQVCFMIPVRKGNGQTSLNNVFIEAEVDKKDIGLFLSSTDKSMGVDDLLKEKLLNEFNNLLLELYPDTELVELMVQLYGIDLIVENTSILGDTFRTALGLEDMNSMDVEERRLIVKAEVSKANGRYDIVVDMIWKTDMELTSDTPRFVGEVKKKDFGRNDRNQIFAYAIKDSLVAVAAGISVDITPSAQKSYGTDIDEIKRAGSLPNVTFANKLVDIMQYDFNSPAIKSYYLGIAKKIIDSKKNN